MGQLISLSGKKIDLVLVEEILASAIALEGSLLRGIFTKAWGGSQRAVALYSKVASSSVPAEIDEDAQTTPAEQAVAAAAPAFKVFIEEAIRQKLSAMMNDPECERVNMELMMASQKALAAAGSRGVAAVKENIEFTEAWSNFRSFMEENLPVGNFDALMAGHLDALSEALVSSAKVASNLRRGTGLKGGNAGRTAFAMLGAETGEMYREELDRIMELASDIVAKKAAQLAAPKE